MIREQRRHLEALTILARHLGILRSGVDLADHGPDLRAMQWQACMWADARCNYPESDSTFARRERIMQKKLSLFFTATEGPWGYIETAGDPRGFVLRLKLNKPSHSLGALYYAPGAPLEGQPVPHCDWGGGIPLFLVD